MTLLGIYEFHGDTLVIANAGDRRPKRIATEGPDSLVIYTLQRRDESARRWVACGVWRMKERYFGQLVARGLLPRE